MWFLSLRVLDIDGRRASRASSSCLYALALTCVAFISGMKLSQRERDKNVARDYDCHGLLYGGWLGSVGPRRLDITILLTCDEVGWYPETRD